MRKIFLGIIILMAFGFSISANAHPGRLNKYGCHTCKTNCAKRGLYYGQYHCHR